MKKHLLFLFFLGCTLSMSSQSTRYVPYAGINKNGEKISYTKAEKISKEEEQRLSENIAENTGSLTREGDPVYVVYQIDYNEITARLTEITGQNFENKVFLVEYTFENDPCNSNDNSWNKSMIRKRKQFLSPQKKEIEKRNKEVIVLSLFEEGITLANSPNSQKEFFFQDKDNYFRKALFQTPAYCGAHALINPRGQALVINGEAGSWYIGQHLKPETWALFFPKENGQ